MQTWRLAALALAAAVAAASPALAAKGPNARAIAGWTAAGAPPDMAGIWELVRGPNHPPGRRGTPAPLNPKYEAQLKVYMTQPAHSPKTANCLPPGMPQVMDVPYPVQILYAPGEVVVIQEGYMQVRHILADGRAPNDDPDLTFNGYSIGRWDGDAFVVETTGLTSEVELAEAVPHGPKTRILERFQLIQPNLLEVRTTVTDPEVLSRPWDYVTHYERRPDWDMTEYVCEQNNHETVAPSGKIDMKLNGKPD